MKRTPYTDTAEWFWPRKESTWLKLREGDVTATAAAALFGVSPYATAFDLFHRLAGNVEVVIEESERMLWGKRLQNAITLGICEDHGWEIVDRHPFLYARSKRFPGLGASPDTIVRCPKRGLGLLEIKNVDKFVALDEWADDEAPVHIELQVQQQIEVTGLAWGAIGGLIGGNTPRVFIRERDAEVGAEIGRRAVDLLDRVRRNDPPPPDYVKDWPTIKTLYRVAEVGTQLDLDEPDDADRAELVERLIVECHAADIVRKNAADEHTAAKARLLEAIGGHETVFGRGWKVNASTTYTEERVQTVKATSYRNLRISKPKPKKGTK